MSGNLHKSDAGWERVQALTNSTRAKNGRAVVRSSKMNFSPDPAVPNFRRRSRKSIATTDAASSVAHQPHLRNRRRVVVDPR